MYNKYVSIKGSDLNQKEMLNIISIRDLGRPYHLVPKKQKNNITSQLHEFEFSSYEVPFFVVDSKDNRLGFIIGKEVMRKFSSDFNLIMQSESYASFALSFGRYLLEQIPAS